MFQELVFEDIVFGIFPKIGARIFDMAGRWAKNSVGDVLEMVMQVLEGLAFIHDRHIAHRDVFLDNFLVQWHPESLVTNTISPSRPRVYLIDFEVAVEFPPQNVPRMTKATLAVMLRNLLLEAPTTPLHKLDIWQLGTSLVSQFRAQIPAIDRILLDMTHDDPKRRTDAQVALDQLQNAVYSLPPKSLFIEPYTRLQNEDKNLPLPDMGNIH